MGLYCLANARTPAQAEAMRALAADNVCCFCDLEPEPLHRTAWWAVVPNRYPYAGTALHLLLVAATHVTDMRALPAAARADLWAALDWVGARYGLAAYQLRVRNGDPALTGGTIAHLHVHVTVDG